MWELLEKQILIVNIAFTQEKFEIRGKNLIVLLERACENVSNCRDRWGSYGDFTYLLKSIVM